MNQRKFHVQDPQIRPVQICDDAALRGLYTLSIRNNVKGFIQDLNYHGDIADRAREYQSGGGEMLGLFDGENLTGFGGLRRMNSLRSELCKLHVHPDYQGQGLGKRLVLELFSVARNLGVETVELHVTTTQEAAIGAYRSLEFKETARKIFTIGADSYDTLFMERDIHL